MRTVENIMQANVNSVLNLKVKKDNTFFSQFELAVKNLEILNAEEQISRNFFVQQFAMN